MVSETPPSQVGARESSLHLPRLHVGSCRPLAIKRLARCSKTRRLDKVMQDPRTELVKRTATKQQAAILLAFIKAQTYRKTHGEEPGLLTSEWAQGYHHSGLTFNLVEVQAACEQVISTTPGLAPIAQSILDTLNGKCPWAPSAQAQPHKCPTCKGTGDSLLRMVDGDCPCCDVCEGTGHNMSGTLPAVEV